MKGNVIVGQSGGPTAAINASLAGVYRTAKDRGANKVYGMLHGIQGLLKEKYIDLSDHIKTELDAELLKRTPAAFLGSCRYKLPEIHENREVYDKIFEILDKLDIEAFIYIGGNDSMDTIKKLSDYAIVFGHSIRFIGCPKTIDNDLALTDHTPGYGSAAKYIGTSMKEIIRDSFCLEYEKGVVSIVEIMGRNAGWLTGSTALSQGEDCEGPDLIYLPELPFDLQLFGEKIRQLLQEKTSIVVAVSEGIRTADDVNGSLAGIPSNYLDLAQLEDYWSPRRLNHHTEATSMQYAVHEALRCIVDETLEARWARHSLNDKALCAGLNAMGLSIFGDIEHKMPVVTAINIPEEVDGKVIRGILLNEFGIEIATSFGPLDGKILRIGNMGYSSQKRNILILLGALEAVMLQNNVKIATGEGVAAAMEVYKNAEK